MGGIQNNGHGKIHRIQQQGEPLLFDVALSFQEFIYCIHSEAAVQVGGTVCGEHFPVVTDRGRRGGGVSSVIVVTSLLSGISESPIRKTQSDVV